MLGYRSARAGGGAGWGVPRALLGFGVGFLFVGVLLCGVAVFGLGQWNSYLGRDWSLAFDGVGCLLGAGLATGVAAAVSGGLRWVTGRTGGWRSPVAWAAGGAVCAVAAFGPGIADVYLTGTWSLDSGSPESRGWGARVGWTCLLLGPGVVSVVLFRWRGVSEVRRMGVC